MKNSISQRKNLTIMMTFALILIASTSFACGGYWGYGNDSDAANAQTSLTPEQQQKLDAIKEKYSPQLKDLRAKLDSKADEYRAARAKDETTVATLNQLQKETTDLQRQYRALLDQASNEVDLYADGGFGPGYNCPNYDDNNRGGMMSYGRHMGPGSRYGMGYGMGGRYQGCD